jgi:hypothetical protein
MTASTIPLTLDLTLGAANVGTLVATLLFGMFLIQLHIYASSCTSDRLWLKLLITAAGFIPCSFRAHACNDCFHRFLEALHMVQGAILTRLWAKGCADTHMDVHLQSECAPFRQSV